MRTAFYVCGGLAELAGILLVASPDLVPGAIGAAGWLRQRWRPIENRLRKLVGLGPRPIRVEVSLSDSAATTITLSAIAATGAQTTEEKVEWLLQRDQVTQRTINELEHRITGFEQAVERNLGSLSDQLEGRIGEELAAVRSDYRAARIIGAFSLLVGLVLTTWANFLHSTTTFTVRPLSFGGLTEWLTAVGGVGAFVATGLIAFAAFRQIRKVDEQASAARDQVQVMREAARDEAAAVGKQIEASIAQSEAIRDAARVIIQARVLGHVTGPAIRGPDESWSLGPDEIAFQYRLVNEGSGPALNIRHGIELGGKEHEFGDGMETRSLGPGEASPPFNDALGSYRPLSVVVARSELPERWPIQGHRIWARFDNALGERYETRNPSDPQLPATFHPVRPGQR